MKRLCSMVLMGAFAAGCVSASAHEDLKRQYDEARGALQERGNQLDDANRSLTAVQQEQKDLLAKHARAEQQVADLERECERLKQELAELEARLAGVVQDRSQLTATTKQLTDALRQLSERKAQAEARVSEFRRLLSRFKDMIDAGKLQVRLVDGRMVLALPTDVLFASGSAELSKDGLTAVTEVATVLAGLTERRVQVEGHTDNVPINTARYPSNWELSSARALGVVKAMCQSAMACTQLSAAAFGEYHPVASNDTDEGRRNNRRIEVVLLPDLSMLPGFEELEAIVNKH